MTKLTMVLAVVDLLLEDVAEKPSRLVRAQELARRDIAPILTGKEADMKKLADRIAVPLRLDNDTLAAYQQIAKMAGVEVNDVYCVVLAMAALKGKLEKETAPKGRVKKRKKKA